MQLLTSEKKLSYFNFYILDKIKEYLDIHSDEGKIEYIVFLYPSSSNPYQPNQTEEQLLLKKLIDKRVIEEIKEKSDFQLGETYIGQNPKSAGIIYHLRVINSAFKILYKEYFKKIKEYQRAGKLGNSLTIYQDGNVVYISKEGKKYTGKFGIKTDSFILLKILIGNPKHIFTFVELSKNVTEMDSKTDFLNNERKIRDAIGAIKKKLGYQGKDLFITDNGFGLACDVIIKQ